jgi:hypothetical protein
MRNVSKNFIDFEIEGTTFCRIQPLPFAFMSSENSNYAPDIPPVTTVTLPSEANGKIPAPLESRMKETETKLKKLGYFPQAGQQPYSFITGDSRVYRLTSDQHIHVGDSPLVHDKRPALELNQRVIGKIEGIVDPKKAVIDVQLAVLRAIEDLAKLTEKPFKGQHKALEE